MLLPKFPEFEGSSVYVEIVYVCSNCDKRRIINAICGSTNLNIVWVSVYVSINNCVCNECYVETYLKKKKKRERESLVMDV